MLKLNWETRELVFSQKLWHSCLFFLWRTAHTFSLEFLFIHIQGWTGGDRQAKPGRHKREGSSGIRARTGRSTQGTGLNLECISNPYGQFLDTMQIWSSFLCVWWFDAAPTGSLKTTFSLKQTESLHSNNLQKLMFCHCQRNVRVKSSWNWADVRSFQVFL